VVASEVKSALFIASLILSHARLGIEIKLLQIRLNPGVNKLYLWKVLSEKQEHFSTTFSKNVSEHPINAYRELSEGVDVSFEAIPSSEYTGNTPDSIISVSESTNLKLL
jgi:hypothetical protein